ncbi:MAG: sporulation protein YqfD [Oscillospiraceae bacterium]|nr:sporulation protein YqfD [Oscillospiraceae bacterium]
MFNNIRGVITFEAVAPEPSVFINHIKSSIVSVTDLKYEKGKIRGDIYKSSFGELQRVAAADGAQVGIVGRRGGVFTVRRYKRRLGLAAGFFLAFLMIAYLSNVVMGIEIYGNESMTDEQVVSILNDYGIKIGAFIPSIDLREVERRVVSSSGGIAWIGIRSSGCFIQAEISELVTHEEIVPSSVPCNIVSARDAQIVAVKNVYMGMLVPMLYDGVKKGDLLISGTVEDGKGGVYYAHSMGEIIGRYDEKQTFYQPFSDERQNYTGKTTRKYFYFFGAKIPLYIGKNDFEQYEYDENTEYFELLGLQLPMGIITSEYRCYSTEQVSYSPEQAKEILEEKIKLYEHNFLSDEGTAIVDKEVYFSENAEGMTAVIRYTLESNIGITQEIMAK